MKSKERGDMWWIVGIVLGLGYLVWRERTSPGRMYQQGYLSGLQDITSRRKTAAMVIKECEREEVQGRGSAYVSGRKVAGKDFNKNVRKV